GACCSTPAALCGRRRKRGSVVLRYAGIRWRRRILREFSDTLARVPGSKQDGRPAIPRPPVPITPDLRRQKPARLLRGFLYGQLARGCRAGVGRCVVLVGHRRRRLGLHWILRPQRVLELLHLAELNVTQVQSYLP